MHSDKLGWWAFTRNGALSWAGTIFFSLLVVNFAGWLVVALVSTRDVDGWAIICGLVFSVAMTARFTINTIWLRRERRTTSGPAR